MIRFVPAWYTRDGIRYSADNVWLQGGAGTGVDDIVTQARVFGQGDEDVELIVLNYAPSLRRFLHRQHIFDTPYWSFFDEIQGLGDDYTHPLNFLELEWPEDASFFYNPFIVTVMQGTNVYARVYLTREGTLRSVRYYGDEMPTVERIFDDRGFLSSVLMHDAGGQPMTQYYLSRDGDVIVSEDIPSGRIDVVQNAGDRFRQSSYDGWNTLMSELLTARLSGHGGETDTVVLALSDQHNDLIASVLTDQRLVLSSSDTRPYNASSELVARASAVFTDVPQAADVAGADLAGWGSLPVLAIYPLVRRATFGASANESRVYISLFVDNITTEELDYAIASTAPHLVGNDHTFLLVCSFRSQDVDNLQRLNQVLNGYRRLDLDFQSDDESALLGVDVGIASEPEERIQLTFVDREADLIATMAKSRVLVDLGAVVHHRLAAAAIDAGVPQINRYEHALSTHRINGYVIDDESELPQALDYFLNGLEHWNQSLVQCGVLEDLFSAKEILGRWELLKGEVAYARPADRR